MKAHKYPANPSTLISEYHWLQVILRGAAALTWITFILFCIASAISFGLCCADDGVIALAAKSLAHGYGYRHISLQMDIRHNLRDIRHNLIRLLQQVRR